MVIMSNFGGIFALVIVLFVLLIIIGCACSQGFY
ncbi:MULTISPECIES: YjcZ family sporulation protein [Bacillaceae]|nr:MULTISPECIES: YjcZ family sporulation protein [unclassified Cytobacillus]MDX8361905.1 YjcZ family sporulation protein [Cytobacillus sp. IB215316]MDX8366407.1 YjcZ family sporulation protein [Cytobacillus sp. IB215665]